MLKVNFLHICDSVIIDTQTGKISIIGIFTNLNSPSFPSTVPTMSLVVGFEGPEKSYDIEIVFLDEKAEIVKIPVTIKTGKNQLGNWVQNLIGYTIPRDLTQKIVIKYKGENIYSSFIEINNK